jgi:hypothetical protein
MSMPCAEVARSVSGVTEMAILARAKHIYKAKHIYNKERKILRVEIGAGVAFVDIYLMSTGREHLKISNDWAWSNKKTPHD